MEYRQKKKNREAQTSHHGQQKHGNISASFWQRRKLSPEEGQNKAFLLQRDKAYSSRSLALLAINVFPASGSKQELRSHFRHAPFLSDGMV